MEVKKIMEQNQLAKKLSDNEEDETNQILDSDEATENESFTVGDDIYYGTGKIASLLGENRDKIRIFLNDFADYLNLSYSKSGKGRHVKLCSCDIDLLETIIRLRKTHSIEETKLILNDPVLAMAVRSESSLTESVSAILQKSNELLLLQFKKLLDENNEKLLEDQTYMQEIQQENRVLRQEMEQLKDVINEQQLDIKELLERIPEKQEKRTLFQWFKK